jgi:hypothetical protein
MERGESVGQSSEPHTNVTYQESDPASWPSGQSKANLSKSLGQPARESDPASQSPDRPKTNLSESMGEPRATAQWLQWKDSR